MFALLLSPLTQTFAAACAKPTFLGLVPWYQYLNVQAVQIKDSSGKVISTVCQFSGFDALPAGGQSPFLLIGLAILDDLIRVAALVAVGYVIYGGIQYVTSQGSPDATSKARQTILNALIGLTVAIIATAVVSYIGSTLAGKAPVL